MPVNSTMTVELARNLAYKYVDYVKYKNIVPFIQFYGGEPTLNFDVIKIMSEIFRSHLSNDVEISFITNGTLCLNNHIDFIKEYNIGVGISLDGPDYINNINRVSLSTSYYNNVMNNIHLLKDANINYAISLTITDNVLSNANDVLCWIKNLGVKSVNYNFIQCCNLSDRYSELSNEFLLKSLNELKKISNERINRKVIYFASDDFIFSDCAAGYGNQATITPDGFVTICQGDFMNSKKFYCDIKDMSFFEVESVLKNKNIYKKRAPIYDSDCLCCEAIKICGGSCDMKRLNIKTPVFCNYTKSLLRWCIIQLSNGN